MAYHILKFNKTEEGLLLEMGFMLCETNNERSFTRDGVTFKKIRCDSGVKGKYEPGFFVESDTGRSLYRTSFGFALMQLILHWQRHVVVKLVRERIT